MFGVISASKYNIHLCKSDTCCDDVCAVINPEDLGALIYASLEKMSEYADSELTALLYFGSPKIEDSALKFRDLDLQRWALDYQLRQMVANEELCLCDEKIQDLIESVKDIVDPECAVDPRKDLIVDTSGINKWVLNNPSCIAREKWEELLYIYCGDLNFNIDVIKTIIDYKKEEEIGFDVIKASDLIGRCCEECDVNFVLTINEENCMIQFNSLSEIETCDLSYSEFKSLRTCGVSYKTLKDMIDCGLNINYSSTQGCPVIKTDVLEIPVCERVEKTTTQTPP